MNPHDHETLALEALNEADHYKNMVISTQLEIVAEEAYRRQIACLINAQVHAKICQMHAIVRQAQAITDLCIALRREDVSGDGDQHP